MLQIRIHGRGGQGVVTAADMLSLAAFEQGRHAQAFPSFGSERTGAPVVAFCRIDDHEIRLREPIMVPDRSEEHTSELQSLMRISYAVFCLKKKKKTKIKHTTQKQHQHQRRRHTQK